MRKMYHGTHEVQEMEHGDRRIKAVYKGDRLIFRTDQLEATIIGNTLVIMTERYALVRDEALALQPNMYSEAILDEDNLNLKITGYGSI